MKKVRPIIVIPLYKHFPSEDDLISIAQCFSVLRDYPIVAVTPENLPISNYGFEFSDVQCFDEHYFDGIAGYNRLMLSSVFYDRFSEYTHMLVYQTDAIVFSDQLSFWCELDYDYIGAPWLYRDYTDIFKYLKEHIRGWLHRKLNLKEKETGLPTELQFHNVVGNGGLSLRKIGTFLKVCEICKQEINYYLERPEKQFNEDVFWSIGANRKHIRVKKPPYKTALHFAIESNPGLAFKLIKDKLPFGCHAWNKYRDFWEPIFRKENIKL